MSESPATLELFDRYVISTYGRFSLRLERGEGSWVWDEEGRKFLDFGAGIAVTSLGHGHPRVVERMREQLGRLVHTSNLYYTRPQGELAKRLVEIVGAPGKVFFCNSGAEANEALFKLSRKFGNECVGFANAGASVEPVRHVQPRHGVVTMLGSFHGRTLGGIAATGQDKVKKGFEPIIDTFSHIPFNDTPALIAALEKDSTVAVLLEPVQGEGGIHAARADFLRTAREVCDRRSALLLFDEVQCGLGRTGDWNGWETVAPGVLPDAVSWAKGIAGGFPLGAIWVSSRPVRLKNGDSIALCDLLGPGSHGTTFGGTPLICSGALEVLAVIEEEGLLANARARGAQVLDSLRALHSPWIREVRGVGLMVGIELAADFASRAGLPKDKAPALFMVERLHEAGLLTIPSGAQTLRWLPPLNVSESEVGEAVRILASVLAGLPAA